MVTLNAYQLKQPGSIVVNSSMTATQLVKAFAFEWAEHGIRVNAVSPGYVKTEMTAMGNQDMQKVWLDRTPIGRMANPAEIGKSIAFLASGLSTYTTGSELLVDGGYS
ncbi:Sorbose reductase SOU1 [Rhizoctonia solani AG-1 IB]|uniref:Sorbose reductase SOU1 n=1 Tax=Thanatephorus cucumeris (strain AG1-IB / isolate 7/3/14) TaxID=1108050 RepID=M5C626_THACB|nr:Sorbose reductase SOU1 [Rhizoctonia solani AG-1 IB]